MLITLSVDKDETTAASTVSATPGENHTFHFLSTTDLAFAIDLTIENK